MSLKKDGFLKNKKMVSKKNLQSELENFNKDLDKHLVGAGVDLFDETIFSSASTQSPHISTEELILLTQSLKDIRVEMNLMRKHLSSDTEMMLKSLMGAQQRQFNDEMRQFQEQTFKLLKIFDPSKLKEVVFEIERLSDEHKNIFNEISNLKKELNPINKKLDQIDILNDNLKVQKEEISSSFNEIKKIIKNENIDTSKKLDQFERVYTSLIENKFKTLDRGITSSNRISNNKFSKLNSSFELIDKKIKSLNSQGLSFRSNIGELNNKIKRIDLNSSKLDNKFRNFKTSSSEKINQVRKDFFSEDLTLSQKDQSLNLSKEDTEFQPEENQIEIVNFDEENNISNVEKILDIDSRLKKLSNLK